MARTTTLAVQGILLKNWDGETDLLAAGYIDSASMLVDTIVTNDSNGLLSDSGAEILERWLAAHLYYAGDQGFRSQSDGPASATYQGIDGQGLDSSDYGRRAKTLDPTGYLRAMDNKGLGIGGFNLGPIC